MKVGRICFTILVLLVGLFASAYSSTEDFRVRQLVDRVFAVQDTLTGDQQVVIAAEKGLIVLNSFWSETTARRFKTAIIDALERDDFLYLINMNDRLDVLGGNAAYNDIPIIAHKALRDKYRGKEEEVTAEINDLIQMWRWKEGVARERMPNHEPGSEQAIREQQWIKTCKTRAEELESGFSLVLPTEIYEDRKTLDLDDLTLDLLWWGKAGNDGITTVTIPELKLAIIPVLHPQHLAPYPQPEFRRLDVPRWIAVLEEALEGTRAVDRVLCGMHYTDIWSTDRARTHLEYIRKLWNDVAKAESEGKDLPEIYNQLSLEDEFAFVKEMQVYKDNGDDWIRPQHQMHTRLFFLQHKNPASGIIVNMGLDSLSKALARIRELRNNHADIYFDEGSINGLGYALLGMGKIADAIELLKLNVEVFPESYNVYDSYAEALLKNGDNEAAILSYRKSLALNPENENARTMLQTLESP